MRVSARARGELRAARAARAARGAGRGGAAGGRGRGAGGPSPCPAPGGRRERPEFPRPGGRCGRRSGSLQVTRGAAPAGRSGRACREASGVGRGADAGSPLSPCPEPRGPARARRRCCWELAPGPGLRPGPGSRGTRAPSTVRPGVSCTRDNGRGVKGARTACPRPGSCAPSAPGCGHAATPVCSNCTGAPYQAPAARPRSGHLAARPRAWPPVGRGAGDGWAQPGPLAACPGLKAAPLQRRECQLLRAGCRAERRESRVPPAGVPGATELPLPRAGLEFREAEQVAQPPPHLLRTPRGFWSC